MRRSYAETVNATIDQTAEHLAGLMNVNTSWIQAYGWDVATYRESLHWDRGRAYRNTISSMQHGGFEPSVGSIDEYLLSGITVYDRDLVPSGLGYLASPLAQRTLYIGSREFGGITQKSSLTGGFLVGIRSLVEIGSRKEGTLTKNTAKELGEKTVSLTQTLGMVLVNHPESIHLPDETPTQTQAIALEGLMHMFNGRRFSQFRQKANRIIESSDILPAIETEEWQKELGLNFGTVHTTEQLVEMAQILRSVRLHSETFPD